MPGDAELSSGAKSASEPERLGGSWRAGQEAGPPRLAAMPPPPLGVARLRLDGAVETCLGSRARRSIARWDTRRNTLRGSSAEVRPESTCTVRRGAGRARRTALSLSLCGRNDATTWASRLRRRESRAMRLIPLLSSDPEVSERRSERRRLQSCSGGEQSEEPGARNRTAETDSRGTQCAIERAGGGRPSRRERRKGAAHPRSRAGVRLETSTHSRSWLSRTLQCEFRARVGARRGSMRWQRGRRPRPR